jgi:hypothetical protein
MMTASHNLGGIVNRSSQTLAAVLLAGGAAAQEGAARLGAQDYLDIRALIDQYPHILDNCVGNGYRYADMLTADGTFGVSSEWGKGAKIWFRGREQLAVAGGGTNGCRPAPAKPFKSRVHVWPEVKWTDNPADMPPRNLADE